MLHNPKVALEGSPICARCGLKSVRHELERQGIAMHFCDDCYWGVEKEALPRPQKVAEKARAGMRKTA